VVEHFDGRFEIIRWTRCSQPGNLLPEQSAVHVPAPVAQPAEATGS
jgi:hypothetical protein